MMSASTSEKNRSVGVVGAMCRTSAAEDSDGSVVVRLTECFVPILIPLVDTSQADKAMSDVLYRRSPRPFGRKQRTPRPARGIDFLTAPNHPITAPRLRGSSSLWAIESLSRVRCKIPQKVLVDSPRFMPRSKYDLGGSFARGRLCSKIGFRWSPRNLCRESPRCNDTWRIVPVRA